MFAFNLFTTHVFPFSNIGPVKLIFCVKFCMVVVLGPQPYEKDLDWGA